MKIVLLSALNFLWLPVFCQITFKVDNVTPSKYPLFDTSAKLICQSICQNKFLVHSANLDTAELVYTNQNAFISTIHQAYSDHRPLAFGPDDVWLLILQGIGAHIQNDFINKQDKYVKHSSKKEILVRNDKLAFAQNKDWETLLTNFKDTVKLNSKGSITQLMDLRFSTTNNTNIACQNITILEAVKDAYVFGAMSGCGIPQISLKGSKEDWQKLYNRVADLKIEGLENWFDCIKWPLQELVNVYDNKINMPFWKSIYKDLNYYGKSTIKGWIVKFFPYTVSYDSMVLIDTTKSIYSVTKSYSPNLFLIGYDYQLCNYTSGDFPNGISEINITYLNRFVNTTTFPLGFHKLLCYGGFGGIHQNKTNLELSPYQFWGIGYDSTSEAGTKIDLYNSPFSRYLNVNENLSHTEVPQMAMIRDESAIFHKPKLKYFSNLKLEACIEKIKKELLLQIEPPKVSDSAKVVFWVTYSGNIAGIESKNLSNTQVLKIHNLLQTQFQPWIPAMENIGGGQVRRVNYKVEIKL